MKRILGLLALLVLSTAAATAQTTIKGKVIGSDDGLPIAGAYVIINATEPDAAKRTTLTDVNGGFSVVSREKNTNVTISFIGFRSYYKVIEPAAGKNVDLGTIKLQTQALVTETAQVTAKAPMAIMKGDTLQYNAAAFKANPDASSEDLLKKMPGVTTDDDGAVEVHGQKVGKVYVDGKEYFADDPAVALKTLPADVVESMQLFDDKSDESKFSGFDDGERIKAINIVTKNGVSTSTFGKAYGGYGSDSRYSAGVAANIFNTDHRFTVIGQRNNVNNQGFTLNDIASSMSSGRGGMGGGIDANQFTTSVRGGIQTTTMAGLNYQGEFAKKVKLGASYFFNNVNADQYRTIGQIYSDPAGREYYDTTATQGYNYQHRFNMRLEWNPDSTNRIFFMPRVTYSTNHGNSMNHSLTLQDGSPTNTALNDYRTRLGMYDASANLWWMHRFAKAGRTMSLGGSAGGSNGWGDRDQISLYGSLKGDDTPLWGIDTLNQIGTLGAPGFNVSGRVSYAEPLSKSSRLQFSYNISYNTSESRKLSYNWDPTTNDYLDVPDPVTSNLFNRDQMRQSGTIGYNLVKGKVVLNASGSYQYTSLNDDQTFPQTLDSKYNFDAWLPRVRFEYKPTKMQSLTVDYRRSTSTPGVYQLQEVLDLSNPLQVYHGNPGLKQSYTDQIRVQYNIANPEKSTNFNIFAMANFTQDYIANHRRILTQDEEILGTTVVKGAQVMTPVNLNGYINANLFSIYSFRINPLRSNMNVGLRYGYAKTPSMQNDQQYMARTHRTALNLSLTSNISEKVDFTVAYRPSLNFTKGSTGSFDRYVGSDLSGFLNIFLWKGLFINADATWRNSFGTQESYSQHYALVNAAVGYKFLKYKQAEVRISGYDLLNQNRAFWQSSQDTYTQINTTNILKRYFMVSFTYKFDTRKGRSAENYGSEERGSRSSSTSAPGSHGNARPMSGSSMGGGRGPRM